MATSIIYRLLVLCMIFTVCICHPYFRESLPNGKNVPHPCIDGAIWEGVGHINPKGAGARNAFGIDFKNNRYVWDTVLCNKDSDGDGKTNGEELGDPDCTWTPGSKAKYEKGLSHPGVCEPLDSADCGGRPSICEDSREFECDAVKEPKTFDYTVRFPTTVVPAKETTYICITFELPMDQEYHLVAYKPVINNTDVMHHTLIYGCEGVDTAPGPLMQPTECGGMRGCREVIGAWASGGIGNCLYRNMGFLIGANKGLKYAVMEHHWNNPQKVSDYTDSSGITFYLTPELRPYNAGFLKIGQTNLDIPPGQPYYSTSGTCNSSCFEQLLDGNIYISAVANHMHLLGKSQSTELRRGDSFVMHLAKDKVYDYNTPVNHIYENPVMIHEGDEFKTTCTFNSESRNTTTHFGDATSDEMCLAYITYYPKENLRRGSCISFESLNECEMRDQDIIHGCNVKKVFDISDMETLKRIRSVANLCEMERCLDGCLDYVRELKQQPCFTGDVGKYIRTYTARYSANSQESRDWFARLDSCDAVLLEEEKNKDISAGYSARPFHFSVILLTSLFVFCG